MPKLLPDQDSVMKKQGSVAARPNLLPEARNTARVTPCSVYSIFEYARDTLSLVSFSPLGAEVPKYPNMMVPRATPRYEAWDLIPPAFASWTL